MPVLLLLVLVMLMVFVGGIFEGDMSCEEDCRLDSSHWTVDWTPGTGLHLLEGNSLLGLESSSLHFFYRMKNQKMV